jgi:tRNA/tmRNA/rRNA uracil-C5-methylase (TrmA/RlmC/RlmD family)
MPMTTRMSRCTVGSTDATAAGDTPERVEPGDIVRVRTGVIAHGGHVIAHHGGRTLFVRHALPGEVVEALVTEVNRKIVRADAVAIMEPSSARVTPPCPWAGPGSCGGCDFQHVDAAAQRGLKSEVLRSSLERFAGLTREQIEALGAHVLELPGHPDGLGWRTRIRWAVDAQGHMGLRRHRSHDVIPVDRCLLAVEGHDRPERQGSGAQVHTVRGRTWAVDGFWQAHNSLPEALVSTVLEWGMPQRGERWWDLYAGAGLFSAFLAESVGPDGRVTAVEADRSAVRSGQSALRDLPQVEWISRPVEAWLEGGEHEAPDGVVLDPPRAGAGTGTMAMLTGAGIPRLVYVACDPVALARDLRVARESGYHVSVLRAFDAFPMTHHFETVALLEID